jgi:multidrug efflux pump
MLTLVMVPVMVTAPNVLWGQIKWVGYQAGRLGRFATGRGRQPQTAVPAGFDGMALEIPADADGAKRYIVSKNEGLTKEQQGPEVRPERPEAAE